MRPPILCKLKKGQLIDAQQGFVDTFNWLVDFVNNIMGDGDLDSGKPIKIDRTTDDRPVVRFNGSIPSGGGSGEVATGQIAVTDVAWLGANGDENEEHKYSYRITRGHLAIGDGYDPVTHEADGNAGKIIIAPDDSLTTYIETSPIVALGGYD